MMYPLLSPVNINPCNVSRETSERTGRIGEGAEERRTVLMLVGAGQWVELMYLGPDPRIWSDCEDKRWRAVGDELQRGEKLLSLHLPRTMRRSVVTGLKNQSWTCLAAPSPHPPPNKLHLK